jgi:hypothetical protein
VLQYLPSVDDSKDIYGQNITTHFKTIKV